MFELKQVKYQDIIDIKELIIERNKVTCIIGESGSGKSTLIKLLNKLISCDCGEIYYNSKSLNELDSVELRRSVIMLPQTPAIFPGSIKENLLIGLKFAEKPLAEDEKLSSALQFVKLKKGLAEDADKLSGGEKQRLALARVILMEPEVFLLDEPSSALDEETEQLIIEAIVQYCRLNKKTLIMVTHSKKIAKTFAERTIELRNGKVLAEREE